MTKEQKVLTDYITWFLRTMSIGIDGKEIEFSKIQMHGLDNYLEENEIEFDFIDKYFDGRLQLYLSKNNFLDDSYPGDIIEYVKNKFETGITNAKLTSSNKKSLRVKLCRPQFKPLEVLMINYKEVCWFLYDEEDIPQIIHEIERRLLIQTNFNECPALVWCMDKMNWYKGETNSNIGQFTGNLSEVMSNKIFNWLDHVCYDVISEGDYSSPFTFYKSFDFSAILSGSPKGIDEIFLTQNSYFDRAPSNFEQEETSSDYEEPYDYNSEWSNDEMWDHIQRD